MHAARVPAEIPRGKRRTALAQGDHMATSRAVAVSRANRWRGLGIVMKAIPWASAQAPWAYQFPHAVELSEGAVA